MGFTAARRWAATTRFGRKWGLVERELADRRPQLAYPLFKRASSRQGITNSLFFVWPLARHGMGLASQGISQEWRGCVACF